jgi:hypothetical protein
MTGGWGAMNPNSQHQLWSRWIFRVYGKYIPLPEVERNALRWLRKGFGEAGHAKVEDVFEPGNCHVVITADVEGVPAHDPGYVRSVRRRFRAFVDEGWGVTATEKMKVKILAGDRQDGRPRDQLIVMGGRVG